MKCGHCGHTVWCQACGRDVVSSQAAWHRRVASQGKCPGCGKAKTKKVDGKHVRCHECRRKHAARAQQRYRDQKKAAA